ncbi:DNA replication/repair protein RecF [Salsuginibacillus kocurii]|uniref:DNA replication/repair protein RecF n=1 Tax=Salsuginibacillus kocurii TaxID=427078 RepID=UPI00037C33FD|nr:DNA replication/repair protein RecF [Salsuginibacillus kocurii]
MYIESLHLKQFRNYKQLSINFEDTVNVIVGENAQGKTNLMEAIYLLALAKSHRTSKDKELMNWEEKQAMISGHVEKRTGPLSLEVILSSRGKRVKVNELEQRKLSEYIGAMNVVMFAPEDLNLVKGGPIMRRRFIDMELGQTSPVYLHDLAMYNRILKQRNQLLKDWQGSPNDPGMMLEVMNDQLAEAAAKVVHRRLRFLSSLEKWASELHAGISRDAESLELGYVPTAEVSDDTDMPTMVKAYQDSLLNKREQERRRGTSLVGPHREDLVLKVNERNVQTYGSQGQQRTAALALKLAEIELIGEEIGDYPILLLDDVLSELDTHRRSHLLNTIQGKVQTFVTSTSVEGIEHQTLSKATVFEVANGAIERLERGV